MLPLKFRASLSTYLAYKWKNRVLELTTLAQWSQEVDVAFCHSRYCQMLRMRFFPAQYMSRLASWFDLFISPASEARLGPAIHLALDGGDEIGCNDVGVNRAVDRRRPGPEERAKLRGVPGTTGKRPRPQVAGLIREANERGDSCCMWRGDWYYDVK